MTAYASALYEGRVTHQRLRPMRHRLGYRIFQMLIDLDELPRLQANLRFFSHNRFNLLGFRDRDHGPGDGPLRPYVEAQLAAADIDLEGGPIRLLCMPRVLGGAFNPLSLYFCHHRAGALAAILYEVNNTFGQRHSYLIPVDGDAGPTVRQDCDKLFFVSPFMEMQMRYAFKIRPPGEDLLVTVISSDAEGPMLFATYDARRAALSDRSILLAFLGHPLQALKVVGALQPQLQRLEVDGAHHLQRLQRVAKEGQ